MQSNEKSRKQSPTCIVSGAGPPKTTTSSCKRLRSFWRFGLCAVALLSQFERQADRADSDISTGLLF